MNRFEHRVLLTDVCTRDHAQATDEARAEVAQDVAIEVLEQKDVELRRVLHQLHAAGIDDDLFIFDVGESFFLSNLAGAANVHPIGQLHDVGFVHHGDLLPASIARVLKSPVGDSPGRGLGRDLEARHDAFGDFVFDAAVEPLGVLPNHDEIDVLVPRLDAGQVANRTDGSVEVEPLAKLDIDGGEALAHRRRTRPLEREPVFTNRVERPLGQHLTERLERGHAGMMLDPSERGLGRLKDPGCRCRYFRADSVARDENDLVRCHVLLPAQE